MSMSFEIFPTLKNIPKCEEIIKYSVQLFNEFLEKEKIEQDIGVIVEEVSNDNKVSVAPVYLVSKEEYHTVFNLNENGEVYVFYHEYTELDRQFWNDELQLNKKAQAMKKKIDTNIGLGYSWTVKKTIGQPAIINLYYGYIAIAIAVLTEGIVYSDDGAWDYSCLPIEGTTFQKDYLKLNKISDNTVKDNITKWVYELKNCSIRK